MFDIFPVIFIGFWIIFIIILIYALMRGRQNQKTKEQIYNKVQLEKQSDIQNYINMLSSNKELEEKRKAYKNSNIYVGIVVVIAIIICIFLRSFHPFVLVLALVVSLLIKSIFTSGYSKIYKNQVIKSILYNYNSNWKYEPTNGIQRDIYRIAEFESFDTYATEDLIAGTMCDCQFAIADVHTQDRRTDSDGDTHYVTLFRGPVAVVELNKLKDFSLFISDNQIKLFSGDSYIELDNQAFEDKYDVFTSDKMIAMRILTPALTSKILELHDKFGFFYEIRLIDGLVFFRFHSDSLFEPNPSDIKQEALSIAYYFNMLDGMKNIMEEIIKTLKEFER